MMGGGPGNFPSPMMGGGPGIFPSPMMGGGPGNVQLYGLNRSMMGDDEDDEDDEDEDDEADILFFYMPGCPYCSNSAQLLKNGIDSKKINVHPYNLAPKEATGFPFFLNIKNGKSYTGMPKSEELLYKELGTTESFNISQFKSNNKVEKYAANHRSFVGVF
jgi:hypothetical protein